jgi:hypothetical protein
MKNSFKSQGIFKSFAAAIKERVHVVLKHGPDRGQNVCEQ